MKTVYRIKDWDKHFEVSQSRKITDSLKWVATPTRHDGKSYKRLMREKDSAALFGAWMLIVEVAAKCPVRGILADEDGPLTAEDLSLKTDAPIVVFERAFKVLSSDRIGWLVGEEWERATSVVGARWTTEHTYTHTYRQTGGLPIDWYCPARPTQFA